MKPGEIVQIYDDPFTQQKPEGVAKLLYKDSEDYNSEYWRVRFVPDNFVTYRTIAKATTKGKEIKP